MARANDGGRGPEQESPTHAQEGGSPILPPVRHRARPPCLPSAIESAGRQLNGPASATSDSEAEAPPPDYAVGYKRPPVSGQFKKGQSGFPSGRPKGSKNTKTLFDQELSSTVSIREAGRTRKLSKREVIVKRIVNKAAEGDPRATEIILRVEGLAQRGGRGPAGAGEPQPIDPQQEDEIDQDIINVFLKMARRAPEEKQQSKTQGNQDDDL